MQKVNGLGIQLDRIAKKDLLQTTVVLLPNLIKISNISFYLPQNGLHSLNTSVFSI